MTRGNETTVQRLHGPAQKYTDAQKHTLICEETRRYTEKCHKSELKNKKESRRVIRLRGREGLPKTS
eukprot:scaffold100775_cov72-Cyclotella_meneghiniana.AAC.2